MMTIIERFQVIEKLIEALMYVDSEEVKTELEKLVLKLIKEAHNSI